MKWQCSTKCFGIGEIADGKIEKKNIYSDWVVFDASRKGSETSSPPNILFFIFH
jgi:hypothetical protein